MSKASRAKTTPTEPTELIETQAVTTGETDGTKSYVVTKKAPPRVAGKRVKEGDSITLTDDQARGELLALHIRLEGLPPKAEAPADAPADAEDTDSNDA